jgi:FixJ family two-component response regulator
MSGTVFVIDDDREMRESLSWLLETVGLPSCAFESPAAFRQSGHLGDAGCLVLDVRMPGQSGLEFYEELLREGHRLPVIFITAHADVPTAVQAMKTGAIEFLEKPFDRRTLLERIFKALELDREWRERQAEQQEMDRLIARLSSRERETLEFIVAGDSNKVMANRLEITERAVEMRRASIMKKLGAQSLAELLDRVITHRVLAELRVASSHRAFLAD